MHNDQLSLFDGSFPTKNPKFPLHSKFVKIIPMTEEETANQFEKLTIFYSFATSVFRDVIVASTSKGVCYLAFYDNQEQAVENMHKRYKNAMFTPKTDGFQQNALAIFQKDDWRNLKEIALHIKGTEFQLKVWRHLLEIPFGTLTNYQDIAKEMGDIKSARPVGTSVGRNPVAYIVPCHRVVPLSGKVGGYMWGPNRKVEIIDWERVELLKSQ